MNKEELEEALKIVKEPIIVNSVEYKYFDRENYNKLVNAIDYCNYLSANVKPYVEVQDKEIDRLNNIISELEKYLKEKQVLYGINQQRFSWGVCGDALDKLKELKEKE